MKTIILNGATQSHPDETTVAHLVTAVTGRKLLPTGQAADGGRLGVAVARNQEIVPRSQWAATAVEHQDALEIVAAVQGG